MSVVQSSNANLVEDTFLIPNQTLETVILE